MSRVPRPPEHLSPTTKRWWRQLGKAAAFEVHEFRTLQAACEAWDRAQEARERIATDGTYVKDRFGQLRAHPAVAVERDARTLYARLIRELALDVEPPKDSRPPARVR
jgi:P27 family predicted phage terminase small subunit